MGLKCSVFGHKFTESTVERDRKEQGSEVIITIREVETCERCGEMRVVSENKEVTSLETPEDVEPEPEEPDTELSGPSGPSPAASGTGSTMGPTEDTDIGAEIMDAESGDAIDETDTQPAGGADTDEDDETEFTAHESAAEDDAVILEDDDEDDRAPGEWPEEPETPEEEEDEPTAAEPSESTDEEFDQFGYSSPDVTDDPVFSDTSSTSTSSDRNADKRTPRKKKDMSGVTVPEGRFRCPECGFTKPVKSSSLREGDFCPKCRTGTLIQEKDPD